MTKKGGRPGTKVGHVMLPEEASDAISNLTASDRASSVASTLALLVFVQIGGVTALAPVIARTLVHWTMPPLWLFLFGVSGFVVSLTCALVMRRAVLRMMQSAIGSAETTSTTLLHAMVERIPQGVALWDHDNRLVLCNQIYRDVFSRIDDHLVAGAHLDNVANTELNAAYFPVSAVPSWFENRKQNHWIGDISERRKIDGCEYEIVDYHCDDDGGTVTLISDISDLKIKEEQLRDAQERYALVSLASTEGLWDMDLRTGRFYVAPRVLSIIGHKAIPLVFGGKTGWRRSTPRIRTVIIWAGRSIWMAIAGYSTSSTGYATPAASCVGFLIGPLRCAIPPVMPTVSPARCLVLP
jgi:PAS domain-containing protein